MATGGRWQSVPVSVVVAAFVLLSAGCWQGSAATTGALSSAVQGDPDPPTDDAGVAEDDAGDPLERWIAEVVRQEELSPGSIFHPYGALEIDPPWLDTDPNGGVVGELPGGWDAGDEVDCEDPFLQQGGGGRRIVCLRSLTTGAPIGLVRPWCLANGNLQCSLTVGCAVDFVAPAQCNGSTCGPLLDTFTMSQELVMAGDIPVVARVAACWSMFPGTLAAACNIHLPPILNPVTTRARCDRLIRAPAGTCF